MVVVSPALKNRTTRSSSIPLPLYRWTDVRIFREFLPVVLAELIEIVVVIMKERVFAGLCRFNESTKFVIWVRSSHLSCTPEEPDRRLRVAVSCPIETRRRLSYASLQVKIRDPPRIFQ